MTAEQSWAQPKTKAEWRDRIIKSLGGSQWNVELDTPTLDHAIWQTLILFNKYYPVTYWHPLGTVTDQQTIDMSDVVEKGTKVLTVKFQRDGTTYYRTHHIPYVDDYRGIRKPRRLFQILAAQERYDFMLGVQPSWRWDEDNQVLYIGGSSFVGIKAKALLCRSRKVEEIPYNLEYDFLNGTVGHAKMLLARILRKYGSIPAAQGGITLDAGDLQREGKEAVEALEKRLDRNFRRLPMRYMH